MGFTNMPDGSFYDPDGVFFDKDGYDEFGGYYDDDNMYIPGELNKHLYGDENDDQNEENDNDHEEDEFNRLINNPQAMKDYDDFQNEMMEMMDEDPEKIYNELDQLNEDQDEGHEIQQEQPI